ncbi:MAG: hypothetical protein ABSD87_15235, partial [Candidatus Acidiferrales bacterium]
MQAAGAGLIGAGAIKGSHSSQKLGRMRHPQRLSTDEVSLKGPPLPHGRARMESGEWEVVTTDCGGEA